MLIQPCAAALRQLQRRVAGAATGTRPFAAASGLAAAAATSVACLDELRSVIKLEGDKVIPYLQRIVSCDVSGLQPGGPPAYGCVLSPQGRFAHDLHLHAVPDAEVSTVLLDCDAAQRRALTELLQHYSLHHQVAVSGAGRSYTVAAAWEEGQEGGQGGSAAGDGSTAGRDSAEAASSSGGGSGSAGEAAQWPADPRLPSLGRRAVLPRGAAPAPSAGWRDYQRWRYRQGVAEGDAEIPSGDATPLEYNLDGLHGISFTKGCYIGQEFVARVHARGVVRKRVMPFRLGRARGSGHIGDVSLDPRSARVFDSFDAGGESLAPIGRLLAFQGGYGLALLRLKQAMAALREGKPLLVGDAEAAAGYAEIWPWRPQWWQPCWGHEEEGGGGDEAAGSGDGG